MSEWNRLILGIDGGGTRTTACLAVQGENERLIVEGKGIAGPSNLRSEGVSESFKNIEWAIDCAFHDASIERVQVSRACFGLAGVGHPKLKTAVRKWAIEKRVAEAFEIVHDGMLPLYGTNSDGIGIALISGTGSFAFGRDDIGQTCRRGGLGYRLGDEGSAFAIAMQGLQAAAKTADHRGPETTLWNLFKKHFEIEYVRDLVAIVHAETISRSTIAGLAHLVFDAAAKGDQVASAVIEIAARELCDLVVSVSVSDSIEFKGEVPVALSGGVFVNNESFVSNVRRRLEDSNSKPFSCSLVSDPVVGAIRIAANLT